MQTVKVEPYAAVVALTGDDLRMIADALDAHVEAVLEPNTEGTPDQYKVAYCEALSTAFEALAGWVAEYEDSGKAGDDLLSAFRRWEASDDPEG
jgi:hypothetical protein